MILRPYQEDAVACVRAAFVAGKRAVMLVAMTGSGKTVVASRIIELAIAKGTRIIFASHRRELVAQASRKLRDIGVQHGVIAAGQPGYAPHEKVQVCSIQTLRARPNERPPAELIIFDECHHCRCGSFQSLREYYPAARVVGLTATPIRNDGRGLGEMFDALVSVSSPSKLIAGGFITDVEGYAYDRPDLEGIEKVGADYNEKQLGQVMGDVKLTGSIVGQWKAHASHLKTVCFCVHIEHSQQLAEAFQDAGVNAEHLDGTMPAEQRDAILARLHSGETRVVCNCNVLSEGWDEPTVGCVVLARPTMSLALALQFAGRSLRPACYACGEATDPRLPTCQRCGSTNIKRLARLHDHAGIVIHWGLPTSDRQWTLEKDGIISSGKGAQSVRTCKRCFAVYLSTAQACPRCGFRNPKVLKTVCELDGQAISLAEAAARAQPTGPVHTSKENKQQHYFHLLKICRLKGRKIGWASHCFMGKYNEWPPREWQVEFEPWFAAWRKSHPETESA